MSNVLPIHGAIMHQLVSSDNSSELTITRRRINIQLTFKCSRLVTFLPLRAPSHLSTNRIWQWVHRQVHAQQNISLFLHQPIHILLQPADFHYVRPHHRPLPRSPITPLYKSQTVRKVALRKPQSIQVINKYLQPHTSHKSLGIIQ